MTNTQCTDEQPWTCRGCGVPISLDKGMNDVLSHKCHTPTDDSVVDWENSHEGKLWSTAVEKCFEAPFPKVALQHLLFRISQQHHTHIENARREERTRIIDEIENDPQIPIPRPYEVAWILTKLQALTNKES